MNNIPIPPVPGPNTDPNRVPPPGPGREPPPTPDPGPGRLPSSPPIQPPGWPTPNRLPPSGGPAPQPQQGGGSAPPIRPPGYVPPAPVPDPSGDPYGSDNWKGGIGPQPSSTGGQTSNPTLQYRAAQKQAPGAPPIRPPVAPAPTSTGVDGTANLGTGSTPDFMAKDAEKNRNTRRAGTNFGLRQKMQQGGVSGYTAPSAALTGSGKV